VDIWALGVTVYAMVFGSLPFGRSTDGGVVGVLQSIRDDLLVFPHPVEPDLENLLFRLLDKNPSSRICVAEILTHPWLQAQERIANKEHISHVPVDVSVEEINLAFTPINNFILMTKLKIKMHNKLTRARNSIETRSAHQPKTSTVPSSSTLPLSLTRPPVADGDTEKQMVLSAPPVSLIDASVIGSDNKKQKTPNSTPSIDNTLRNRGLSFLSVFSKRRAGGDIVIGSETSAVEEDGRRNCLLM